MDLTSQAPVEATENCGVFEQKGKENQPPPAYVSMVDPFLVEALQNPRHRLTILRMELDLQKFLQSSDLQQFEFPHFPTSYLRLAAHRVAQHYGLQTMVQDNVVDGQGLRILVIKKPESKFPAVCLSDVPAKESENGKLDQIKIVIRPRPKASSSDASELGLKRSPVRTVEERKEEYDRARARIFSNSSNSESEDALARATSDGRNLNVDDNEVSRNLGVDGDKSLCSREIGNSSRVAIFRDRRKDRTDPDYDRSYDRYVKSMPSTQGFSMAPFNMQKFQPPFVQYDSVFPQPGQMPAPQASISYRTPVMSPYCAMGLSQVSRDTLYMQWPTPSMMYAQSYDQLRHGFFQGRRKSKWMIGTGRIGSGAVFLCLLCFASLSFEVNSRVLNCMKFSVNVVFVVRNCSMPKKHEIVADDVVCYSDPCVLELGTMPKYVSVVYKWIHTCYMTVLRCGLLKLQHGTVY
ncbi:UNVERIFIED_CONTAM: R3H domain-containing protein 1 [Sesamum angustifolium]|uniref:R3H domain-containing protein 1 n=1 Tax=Sesamum angustifolium TaxID=2727405 RepID=A0AAW2PVV5_9LAMI